MATVEDRHAVFLSHGIDGIEKAVEVLFGVDIFFSVGREEDVLAFLQSQTLVYVTGLNLVQVLVEHFGHWGAAHIGSLWGYTAGIEVTAGVLAVADVHVGDDIYDSAVGLLWKAFVEAAVTGFHVEDRDVESLGSDDAEAGVGVAQYEDGIGLDLDHEFVTLVYDVAHGGSQVFAYGIHIYFGVCEFEVAEEDSVKVVVVVLAGVGKDYVEVFSTLVDDCCKADDLGTSSYDDEQFEFSVILEHVVDYLTGSK